MHLNADLVTFRRLMVTDLPLLYHWLTTDPVITHFWCHDEVKPFETVASSYTEYITGARPTDPYLILHGATPIGYIATYLWRDYPEYGIYVDLSDAASFDVFIGEATYRNRGLGQGLLTRFLQKFVFANPGVGRCVITPEEGNTSAIRAYEKIGFRHIRTVPDIPGEPGPVYFMRINREQISGEEMQPCSN